MDANVANTISSPQSTVLFVCLHGSAKSLIAAEHLNRVAEARGLAWRGESAGVEPDAEVPGPVVNGLARDGIDVRGYQPRRVAADRAAAAAHVVSFGCELGPLLPGHTMVEQWDDLPLVSDGYEAARDAIVARVVRLLNEL
jgi:arsenate reductase (thioredoxin)